VVFLTTLQDHLVKLNKVHPNAVVCIETRDGRRYIELDDIEVVEEGMFKHLIIRGGG